MVLDLVDQVLALADEPGRVPGGSMLLSNSGINLIIAMTVLLDGLNRRPFERREIVEPELNLKAFLVRRLSRPHRNFQLIFLPLVSGALKRLGNYWPLPPFMISGVLDAL